MITLWDQNYLQEQQTGQPVHPGNWLSSGIKLSPGASQASLPVHPDNYDFQLQSYLQVSSYLQVQSYLI